MRDVEVGGKNGWVFEQIWMDMQIELDCGIETPCEAVLAG